MFERSAIAASGRTARPLAVSASALAQIGFIATALVISIWRVEPMPPVRLSAPRTPINHIKVFTPERAPRAAQAASNALTAPVLREPRPFTAPRHVPARAAMIWDEAAPVNLALDRIGVADRDGGGYGICPGCSGTNLHSPPAPPRQPAAPKPPTPSKAPVPVGGDVRPPVIVHAPKPGYPQLARQAGISGLVRLSAIITTDGKVRALELMSGHPLLVSAALEAVRQWTYQPTLLNGQPVEVILSIDVNFALSR